MASLPLGSAWLEGRAGRGASRYRLGVGEGVPRKGEGLWQGRPMEDGVCSLSWLARWPEGKQGLGELCVQEPWPWALTNE